jgi:GNAT superfamily N-acetyltransferase
MPNLRVIDDFSQIDSSGYQSGYPPASIEDWPAHSADRHIQILDKDQVIAHASLWWRQVPTFPGERLGLIGHFGAATDASAAALLGVGCTELRQEGCTRAVGPMDGNTWRHYRLATDFGSEPPFFLEPWNPRSWPGFFEAADFQPLSNYYSALVLDLDRSDPRLASTEERMKNQGVTIRPIRPSDFEEDLKRIYAVSSVSFRRNYLYTELSEADFLALYLPYRERIYPQLILLAEHQGEPVGFVFGIPDYAQSLRGEKVDTVIGKTLARLPARIYSGLGLVLAQRLHQHARDLGFTRLIHALQHEDNSVRRLTDFYGSPMRRYTLYSKAL